MNAPPAHSFLQLPDDADATACAGAAAAAAASAAAAAAATASAAAAIPPRLQLPPPSSVETHRGTHRSFDAP